MEEHAQPPDPARLRDLAERGVYIGTSSWKYPGWIGTIYSGERYEYRGRFSEARFNRDCLEEYATRFSTVCVDAGYYRFPTEDYLQKLAAQVPNHFRFGFKVTDEITIKNFPNLTRFGNRAGQGNTRFLDGNLFTDAFLGPMESIREKVGVLMLEFSRFHTCDFEAGRQFVDAMDAFFEQVPKGWPLAVEIRNRNFLQTPYFEMLRRHGVAHVWNNWTQMPPVSEQMAIPESRTCDLLAARFLLTPGRLYKQAVEAFQPYSKTQAPDENARSAGRDIVKEILAKTRALTGFIFVNNRLEGHSPSTIDAMLNV